MRIKKTEEQLREVSDHLHYEIWMFSTITQTLALGAFGPGPVNNACLESFAIHARVLLAFFYAQEPREDDVIAEDFFSTSDEWQKARPSMSKSLQTVHKRVGKELAHLTYARLDVTSEAKIWAFVEMDNDMAAVVKKFLDLVRKNLLGEQWKN